MLTEIMTKDRKHNESLLFQKVLSHDGSCDKSCDVTCDESGDRSYDESCVGHVLGASHILTISPS